MSTALWQLAFLMKKEKKKEKKHTHTHTVLPQAVS